MKLGTKRIVLAAVVLIIIGLVQACAGSNDPQINPQSTTEEALIASTAFEVNSLTVNPSEANTGVQVIATARVKNTGDTRDSYTPGIRIENTAGESLPSFRYLNDIDINAGTTELLSFLIPSDTPGTYKVTWGELTEEFKVVKAEKTGADNFDTATNAAAPDFTAVDVVTNEIITLSQFKGSVVLLNFVNYGCSQSLNDVVSKQLMAIKDLRSRYDDLVPVSVFCGCCPPEVLRDFARENGLTWPWILDTDSTIVGDYTSYLKKYGYPTLIFIDREQNIREVIGFSDLSTLSDKVDQISRRTY
ncbi:peroxiredoxin family protein [Chloroflexota bacterium]